MSTFALKMLAVIFMFIDHIGLYFPGAPIWFRWIGRISYPLFLFCMVWGYHYTRNRKVYLIRMYLMSLFMTGFALAVDHFFPTDGFGYGFHNIFASMFLVGVIISIIELFLKDKKKVLLSLGGLFALQILYYMAPNFVPALRYVSGDVRTGIIPNLYLNEYGMEFIVLGVLMYFLREKKDWLAVVYLLFCIGQFSFEMMVEPPSIQWMMALALPFMLSYNNKKGPGLKYFFYVFYPAHTFLLFYLANFVFAQK